MSWFDQLMGVSESSWDYTNIPEMVSRKAGDFYSPQVGYLLDRIIDNERHDNQVKPIHVWTRNGSFHHDHLFDTSSLQVNGPSRALYQVASNFNCLEIAHESVSPFNGRFLTNLMVDSTQGPSAAAGCAAGTILRVVLHRQNPLNLLRDTNMPFRNGKVYRKNVVTDQPTDYRKIRVGLQTDVTALYDRRRGHLSYHSDGPQIDQIYTSTCICNAVPSSNDPVCESFLRASYEGTYAAAIYRQSSRLVLTAIGGGSFNNNPVQIMRIMGETHQKFSSYLPSECEVHFPIYMPGDDMFLKHLPPSMINEHRC